MNKKPTSIDFKAICKRVEKLRGDLNQTDFAIFFNATKSDISRIEKGVLKKPNIDLLSRICLYYGKNLDWLFSSEGDEAKEVSCSLPDDAGAHRIIPSMSRPANPYDNASCESFMKTLKREEIYANSYQNLEHLRTNLETFIEEYYNSHRLHSALGYRSPEEFERALVSSTTTEGATMNFFNCHETL